MSTNKEFTEVRSAQSLCTSYLQVESVSTRLVLALTASPTVSAMIRSHTQNPLLLIRCSFRGPFGGVFSAEATLSLQQMPLDMSCNTSLDSACCLVLAMKTLQNPRYKRTGVVPMDLRISLTECA